MVAGEASFGQAAVSSSPQPSLEAGATPAPAISATATPATASPPVPAMPSLEELDQMFKQSSLGKEADEARMRRGLRDLSNRTTDDADLVAMRNKANSARTDLEKRDRLRAYYTKYYDRMRAKADSAELKSYIDGQKAAHLNGTAQNRVRPSPTAAPSPTPKPAKAPEPPLPQ